LSGPLTARSRHLWAQFSRSRHYAAEFGHLSPRQEGLPRRSGSQVDGGDALPEEAIKLAETHDQAWHDAVAERADMCLDDYIDVEVKLNPSFREFLEEMKADGASPT
jgi:hypothetical protein